MTIYPWYLNQETKLYHAPQLLKNRPAALNDSRITKQRSPVVVATMNHLNARATRTRILFPQTRAWVGFGNGDGECLGHHDETERPQQENDDG